MCLRNRMVAANYYVGNHSMTSNILYSLFYLKHYFISGDYKTMIYVHKDLIYMVDTKKYIQLKHLFNISNIHSIPKKYLFNNLHCVIAPKRK